MKTNIYMSTLLALIIHVMVKGQTPGNQTHQFRMDIMGMQRPTEKAAVIISTNPENHEMAALIEQTQELSVTARKLREEASQAEHQLLLKHIEMSNLSAHLHVNQFNKNRSSIDALLNATDPQSYRYASAQSMSQAAGHFIKTAIEIREEANAQLTDEARYGDMTNAEEFELLALGKQDEALALLKQPGTGMMASIVKAQVMSAATANAATDQYQAGLQEALKQAANLKLTAAQLREAAAAKEDNEKNLMLAEAQGMDKEYILKQIEASGLSAQIHYQAFSENKQQIAALAAGIKDNAALQSKIESLNAQAERFLRMGKEMREEANAQFTIAARYGDMSNAEEEETLALSTQQQALSVLGQGSLNMACR